MTKVFISKVHENDTNDYSKDDMPKCPICGSKPFVSHDIADGFYFGWSVGCPRYCFNDGIHGHDENTSEEMRLTRFYLNSKEECYEVWDKIVERYKNE